MIRGCERIAREKNWWLWKLRLDGRARNPQGGSFEISGPLSPECRDELLAMLHRWEEEGKI